MAKRDEEQKRRLRGEHLESYTQDAPIGALSKIPDIQRGLKQWGPDLAALPGDLLDMLAYAGRKVARGQSERSVPSLGAGAATRGALSKAPKRQQTELSERKDPSMVEEAVRFMNPMMWGNPLKIAQGPLGKVMAMMGGDLSGMTGVIKGKGGNWHPELDPKTLLQSAMRARNMTPEDAVRLGVPPESYELAKTMDNWIQGPLAKYMMRDMGTMDDPIRRLAEQDILHVKPDELNYNINAYGKWPFEGQTFEGKSHAAKMWEGASDMSIGSTPRWQLAPEPDASPFARKYPWALELPEDTPIHSLTEPKAVMDNLGMHQLTDTVYEALVEGKLRPEQLKSGSFGVEAAVRFADKIRREKEAAAEAEALKALVNEATVEHKAYPEGWKWVEFKAPKGQPRPPEVPEEVYDQLQERAVKDISRLHPSMDDDSEEFFEKVMERFLTLSSDWMERNYPEFDWKTLQKALNAEGDYMGHCVGDYCEDVAGGSARIFSLRDPKGKSVVTVEARPGMKTLSEAEQAFYNEYDRLPRDMQELDEWGMENDIPIDVEDWGSAPQAWRIMQIKGSGKKDPMQKITPEDLKLVQPYVQDFLNSQEWSDIRDLSNAGLHDMRSLYGRDLPQGAKRFMTPAEQQEFNKLYPNLESQMSKDLKAGDWEPDEQIEFANGGLVRAPDYFDNLDVFLRG